MIICFLGNKPSGQVCLFFHYSWIHFFPIHKKGVSQTYIFNFYLSLRNSVSCQTSVILESNFFINMKKKMSEMRISGFLISQFFFCPQNSLNIVMISFWFNNQQQQCHHYLFEGQFVISSIITILPTRADLSTAMPSLSTSRTIYNLKCHHYL